MSTLVVYGIISIVVFVVILKIVKQTKKAWIQFRKWRLDPLVPGMEEEVEELSDRKQRALKIQQELSVTLENLELEGVAKMKMIDEQEALLGMHNRAFAELLRDIRLVDIQVQGLVKEKTTKEGEVRALGRDIESLDHKLKALRTEREAVKAVLAGEVSTLSPASSIPVMKEEPEPVVQEEAEVEIIGEILIPANHGELPKMTPERPSNKRDMRHKKQQERKHHKSNKGEEEQWNPLPD